jgi:TrmH family RNA methyltransferase
VEVLYQDLASYMEARRDMPSYAAMLDGEVLEEKLVVPNGLILIGNESRGIRNELAARAQWRIRIPGSGSAESLNAAVAAGIILFMIRKA